MKEGLAYRVGSSRAGADNAEIDALRAHFYRNHPRGHVCQEVWNHERGNAPRPALDKRARLLFDGVHSPDARADQHAEALRVYVALFEVGVLHGELGGGDGEVPALGGDPAIELGGVEEGDVPYSVFAVG